MLVSLFIFHKPYCWWIWVGQTCRFACPSVLQNNLPLLENISKIIICHQNRVYTKCSPIRANAPILVVLQHRFNMTFGSFQNVTSAISVGSNFTARYARWQPDNGFLKLAADDWDKSLGRYNLPMPGETKTAVGIHKTTRYVSLYLLDDERFGWSEVTCSYWGYLWFWTLTVTAKLHK